MLPAKSATHPDETKISYWDLVLWGAIFLFVSCTALVGCHSQTAGDSAVPQEMHSGILDVLTLQPPGQLLDELIAAKSVSFFDHDLIKLGNEFETALPHPNVVAQAGNATFDADWSAGAGLNGVAYCTYHFSVPGYDQAAELNFTWGTAPAGAGELFIALSNWDGGFWDWYSYDGDAALDFGTSTPYLNVDGDILVVVASISADQAGLATLRLGPLPAHPDWLHSWGSAESDTLNAIAADTKGSVYVAGSTRGFGADLGDTLLLKYDATGAFVWARTVSIGMEAFYNDVAVSPQGDVFTCGRIKAPTSVHRFLVQRWSPAGDLIWSRLIGGGDNEAAKGIVATDESVFVTGGTFRDEMFWYDVAVAKFSHEGELQKAWRFGGSKTEFGSDIALAAGPGGDPELHIIANQADDLASEDDTPLYIKLDASLNALHVLAWESSDLITVTGIAVADLPVQRVYITGHMDSIDGRLYLLEVTPGGSPVALSFWLEGEYMHGFGITSLADGTLAIVGIGPGGSSNSGLVMKAGLEGSILSSQCLVVDSSAVTGHGICHLGGQRIAAAFRGHTFDQPRWDPLPVNSSTMSGNWNAKVLIASEWGQQADEDLSPPNQINTGIKDSTAGLQDAWTGTLTLE